MSTYQGKMGATGTLGIRKISNNVRAPLAWQFRQALRWDRIKGLLGTKAAGLGRMLGFGVFTSQLSLTHINGKTGLRTNYGVVSRRLVTTAFVNFVVDQMQTETSEFGDFKFHDSGVGTTAAAIGDTDMETTDGEARVTGTQTEGASANIYQTVGTITYTTTKAITEHGVFSIVTGGTMIDRHVFAAVNVDNTDQIEFTYEITFTAGG